MRLKALNRELKALAAEYDGQWVDDNYFLDHMGTDMFDTFRSKITNDSVDSTYVVEDSLPAWDWPEANGESST